MNLPSATITYTHNNVNQLTNTGCAYDNDGNMTAWTANGVAYSASYDAENRLKTVDYNDGTAHHTEFTYNADNFVAKQVVDGTETRFVSDGYNVIQERDGSNAITCSYVWDPTAPGGIGGLLELTQDGQHYDYLYDGKGNVSALIDSLRAVVAAYKYDVFGVLRVKSGTLDQPYQFSTKQYLSGIDIVKYQRRDYLPTLGRWAENDPMGINGGLNLYVFIKGNPVNSIDPLGLFGTADFFDHYYNGGGTSIDLGTEGLLQNFQNSSSVQFATNVFTLLLEGEAYLHAKSLCSMCDKGTKSCYYNKNDNTTTDVTTVPGLFSVGDSTFFRSAYCHVAADCAAKTYHYTCEVHYYIRDWFTDPLDIGIEAGGTPYGINADWYPIVEGEGIFQ